MKLSADRELLLEWVALNNWTAIVEEQYVLVQAPTKMQIKALDAWCGCGNIRTSQILSNHNGYVWQMYCWVN